jgi:hypothetical protein
VRAARIQRSEWGDCWKFTRYNRSFSQLRKKSGNSAGELEGTSSVAVRFALVGAVSEIML